MKYQSSRTHYSKVISKVKVFKKWVKLKGHGHRVKKKRYLRKGLITGNIHVKYHSSSTHCSKVISNVQVFKKWVKLKSQGHGFKNNGTHKKALSQGILMWNIKALALSVQKLLARLKF